MDTYHTLLASTEAQFTEKRSRFLAFAFPVANEDEAKQQVAALKRTYYDARHVCFAYVLGPQSDITRQNDDGEPSGTAGRPILNQILGHGLTQVLVVVVRYFGGVKLGTGPLGVAYRTAAAMALDEGTVKECTVKSEFGVDVPYTEADVAMRFIRDGGGEIMARDYSATGQLLKVAIRADNAEALRDRLARIHTLRIIDEEPST